MNLQRWHTCVQCGEPMKNLPITIPVVGAPVICKSCCEMSARMNDDDVRVQVNLTGTKTPVRRFQPIPNTSRAIRDRMKAAKARRQRRENRDVDLVEPDLLEVFA